MASIVPSKSKTQSTYPTLSQLDLSDPTLTKLNGVISFCYTKLSNLFGAASQTTLGSTLNADVRSPNQTQPPTDPNAVLTLGSANQLYHPDVQRVALTTGAYVQGPVQPMSSGSSGFTGTINFPGGFLVGATTYFNMNFSGGNLNSVS